MAAPGEKSATTVERERLLALARRLESEIATIDGEAKAREAALAEIADGDDDPVNRVKASAAILSSQHKRADRAAAELSATRRALRALPTEGDAETVAALAAEGKIPTVTDTQRIYGGRFVTGGKDAEIDLRRWGDVWGDD